MTEQETREKIFNIIREFNVKKRRYSTHTEPSDDEELADALIVAGIGDVWSITGKAEAAIASLIKQNKDYKRRAEVAERAIRIYQTQYGDVRFFNFDVAIKQAEKELKGDE